IQKAGFNSETKKLLDEFLGSVDEVNLARKQSFEEALNAKSSFEKENLKDLEFQDSKGNAHILDQNTQEKWLKTFELKSLDEDYIPKQSDEVKNALGGKEIRLSKGSLLKLVERDRTQYISEIKQTLDEPDLILKDKEEVIFAKELNDKLFFTSVGKDYDTHLTIVSNAPKKLSTIENKVDNGAEILYQSSKFENLRYNQTFTDERLITNKIDGVNSTQNLDLNQGSLVKNIQAEKEAKIKQDLENERQRIELERRANEKVKESRAKEWAKKEALAGKAANDTSDLSLNEPIKYQKIKDTKLILDDEKEPINLSLAVVKKEDLKESFEKGGTQGRSEKQDKKIKSISLA
ncbi:hypothetical protein DMB92_09155, partial [Campylobacter sp. MIT 99-7217]|uniref:PBECR2 nuclease fold domain-containing protein n=1 Tax=Campylobacter sp. MIT 99-7217 TaxID=535091 RepID=UPI0021B079F0